MIESELKQFRTPKEKLKNIANNPDYHWIGELYPAVYTREKRIFFMSMDKFFLGNTTIIEPTYSFYNNDITKNAIIFIDEFDATRDRLLNQIITRGLENHIDYLGLFHRVYASLKTRDFLAELTTASKLQQTYLDEHKNAKNPMEIIERFDGVFDETYDRFAMQYSFKTEEDGKGDRSRNFIFNDLQFHSVFEGENAFIDIDTDMKAKQNWLRFTKRRPTEKDGGVLSLLASIKGCLTYFQNGARNLSFNYKHHKDEDKRPGDDDYTFENAIESVLTEFHLSREQIRYGMYFEKYIDYQYSRIEKKTAKLKESDDEKKQRILVSLTSYEIDLLKAEFSAGASKDNIKVFLNRAIKIASEYKNITHDDLLTLLSLAVMVNDKSEAVKLVKNNTDNIEKDRLLKFIANNVQGKKAAWDNKAQLGSEFSALDSVFEASDKEAALLKYLDSWYKNHSGYAWYDSHKGNSDTYCGYWSFEGAAIAIILELNESKLKESIYYPSF